MGVPISYEINGVMHWELPDGTLTTEDPSPSSRPAKQQQQNS